MPYLIDGHNLIPKMPEIDLRSMDDELQLIHQLQEFCHHTGKKVEIYFDNAPAGQARTQSYGPVKAHFIRAGRTADDAIVDRLIQLGRGAKNWMVVSSDRQVQVSARAAHAKIISSEEFVQLFLSIQQDDANNPEVETGISLTSAEIKEWLEIFGGEGDEFDDSADPR